MPKSENERRRDEALRIAEQRRARLEREGHSMTSPDAGWSVSPNMRSEGPNRVISPPDWYGS